MQITVHGSRSEQNPAYRLTRLFLSSRSIHPVEGSGDRFFPLAIKFFALFRAERRLPCSIGLPIGSQFVRFFEKSDSESRRVGCAKCGGFRDLRPHDLAVQDIAL